MAVLACKNITITLPKESPSEVFAVLQRLQAVELIEDQQNAQMPAHLVGLEAELMHQIEVANKAYDSLLPLTGKPGALAFLTDNRIQISTEEFVDAVAKKETLLAWAEEITAKHDEQLRLRDEKEVLEKTIHTVSPLREVDVKIFGDFHYVSFVPFFVHESRNDAVLGDVKKRFPDVVIEAIDKIEQDYVQVAAVAKEDREALVSYLMDNATLINVDTAVNGSFHDVFNQSTARLEEVKAAIAEIDGFMQEKADQIESIAVLKDVLHSEIKTIFAWHALKPAGDRYTVRGYISPDKVDATIAELEKLTDVSTSVTDGDNPNKVVMKNNWFVKPFEMVTRMMGTPMGNGIDPTPILSFFFLIMFGLALSEAGYGVVIAIVTGLLLLFVRNMQEGPRNLMQIIFLAGLSTVVVGTIYGSWFGITPWDIDIANPDKYLPHTRFLINIGVWPLLQDLQLINPLQKIIELMVAMGALGLMHLLLGLAVGFRQSQKRGELVEGLLASGSWFGFLVLSIVTVLAGLSFMKYVLVIYVIIMLPIVGRDAGNIFAKFAKGAFDMFFGVIGYISDTLSYTRLVALGLATGIIASVVNTLATLAGGGLASQGGGKMVIGYLIMLVVFLGGHTFNIALNVLGSYITVGRLHFVEFFGKFFESGGQELQPLSPSEEYIRITNQ